MKRCSMNARMSSDGNLHPAEQLFHERVKVVRRHSWNASLPFPECVANQKPYVHINAIECVHAFYMFYILHIDAYCCLGYES